MPELPEVETTRRGIATVIQGKNVRQFLVHEPRLRWPVPASLPQWIEGQAVQNCTRRGKYLLLHFEQGVQIIHLGMSGSLRRVDLDEERVLTCARTKMVVTFTPDRAKYFNQAAEVEV